MLLSENCLALVCIDLFVCIDLLVLCCAVNHYLCTEHCLGICRCGCDRRLNGPFAQPQRSARAAASSPDSPADEATTARRHCSLNKSSESSLSHDTVFTHNYVAILTRHSDNSRNLGSLAVTHCYCLPSPHPCLPQPIWPTHAALSPCCSSGLTLMRKCVSVIAMSELQGAMTWLSWGPLPA